MKIKKFNIKILVQAFITIGLYIFVIGSPFSISVAQIGIITALFFWIGKVIFIQKFRIKTSIIDIPILIFLLGTILTSLFVKDAPGLFKSIEDFWQVLIVYIIINEARENKKIERLFIILFIISIFVGIYGVWQHFSGWDIVRKVKLHRNSPDVLRYDVVGFFGMHLTYGGYFMVITLAGFGMALKYFYQKNWRLFVIFFMGSLLIGYTVYASYARSAWIGFISGLLLFAFLIEKKKFVILLLLFSITFTILYLKIPAFRYKINTFKQIKEMRRWYLWKGAIKIIKKHPVFGIGHGNYLKYYNKYKEINWPDGKGHPHNDFLNVYITAGIIGFIGYILIWVTLFYHALKKLKELKNSPERYALIGLISAIFAFLVAGLGQNYFTDSEDSMLLWFIVGMLNILINHNNHKIFQDESYKKLKSKF